MYYDLDSINLEAELGIVIGDRDYWSNSYGYDAVTTLLNHMFTDLQLKRVYLHTLDWNERAQRCFEKSGFRPVRTVRRMSHDFILMEVRQEDWLENGRSAWRRGSGEWIESLKGTAQALSMPVPRKKNSRHGGARYFRSRDGTSRWPQPRLPLEARPRRCRGRGLR